MCTCSRSANFESGKVGTGSWFVVEILVPSMGGEAHCLITLADMDALCDIITIQSVYYSYNVRYLV